MKKYKKQYDKAVEEGKKLLLDIENSKIRICELACGVCDFVDFGSSFGDSKNIQKKYTMKNYSTDIGMKYETLRKWVQDYRKIFKKIPKRKLKRYVSDDNPEKSSNIKALFRAARKCKLDTPVEEILKVCEEEISKSKEDISLITYLKYIDGLKFFICHSVILNGINQDNLDILHNDLKTIIKKLDNHFKKGVE